MSLAAYIHRIRHSLGFGVHSPEGFNMVKRVLNPSHKEGYYGYRTVGSTVCRLLAEGRPLPPYAERRGRLLLRLAAELRVRHARLCIHEDDELTESLRRLTHAALVAADSRMELAEEASGDDVSAFGPESLAVYYGRPSETSGLLERMRVDIGRGEGNILMLDIGKELRSRVSAMVIEGIVFEGERSLLILLRHATPVQRYSIPDGLL